MILKRKIINHKIKLHLGFGSEFSIFGGLSGLGFSRILGFLGFLRFS